MSGRGQARGRGRRCLCLMNIMRAGRQLSLAFRQATVYSVCAWAPHSRSPPTHHRERTRRLLFLVRLYLDSSCFWCSDGAWIKGQGCPRAWLGRTWRVARLSSRLGSSTCWRWLAAAPPGGGVGARRPRAGWGCRRVWGVRSVGGGSLRSRSQGGVVCLLERVSGRTHSPK